MRFLSLALGWLALSCAGGGATGSSAPRASGPNATVRGGCGPDDGPAMSIVVLGGPASCGSTAPPVATVEVWGSLPSAPLRLTGNAGTASLCDAHDCKPIANADLIPRNDPGQWSGSLVWSDANGRHEIAILTVECPAKPIMCG